MTFAIAANIRKATIADAFYRCALPHNRWTPVVDNLIRELATEHHIAQVARIMGMQASAIRHRAKRLGVVFLSAPEAREPTKGEWIHYATVEAARAGLQPRLVLSGYRRLDYAKARWRAWAALLSDHPEYSIGGVARVSGHHPVTVTRVLERLSAGQNHVEVNELKA